MFLTHFDWIVVSTSGGKDSQAMLGHVYRQCKAQGVLGRLIAVHADLGQAEWAGTQELAQEQCDRYDIPLHVVRREGETLLDYVRRRKMWPSPRYRYCTSDFKRAPIAKFMTMIAKLFREDHMAYSGEKLGRPVRILSCMGFRAQESPSRAKRPVLAMNERQSSGRKEITEWLPIHDWLEGRVWEEIRTSGVRHHWAYDKGMPRLSCVFCIFAPPQALMIAGKHNPELLDEYVEVEEQIGHQFKGAPGEAGSLSLGDVKLALESGESWGEIPGWGNQ
tara:strand:- start:256 stop:1086 length:831 start_codon:yes stop_codon:yes gene_type:complete